jgi:hypothetical protein
MNKSKENKFNTWLCLNRLPPDDASLLRHQLMIGDIRILPEDIGRVNIELQLGASLSSLKGKGLMS